MALLLQCRSPVEVYYGALLFDSDKAEFAKSLIVSAWSLRKVFTLMGLSRAVIGASSDANYDRYRILAAGLNAQETQILNLIKSFYSENGKAILDAGFAVNPEN